MIVDAILVGLIFYFTFPLLTGYCALQYGRSFWVWFIVGCFLPIVSFLLIFLLIYFDEKTTPLHKLSRREKVESDKLVSELISSTHTKLSSNERRDSKNLNSGIEFRSQ